MVAIVDTSTYQICKVNNFIRTGGAGSCNKTPSLLLGNPVVRPREALEILQSGEEI